MSSVRTLVAVGRIYVPEGLTPRPAHATGKPGSEYDRCKRTEPMQRPFLMQCLLALSVATAAAQTTTPFDRVMAEAASGDWQTRPIGEVVQLAGEQFMGAPYEGGLLDRTPGESLYTGLDRFDCVLFVESALALARGIVVGETDRASFERRIEEQRYRDGTRNGYCSRLHYFTEWIVDNERRGTVHDISREIGGELLEKRLDFMSAHRDSYPLLAGDSLFAGILEMEKDLENHEIWYLPQDRIRAAYPALRGGDILAFVTSVKGLDVSHTGLVYDTGNGGRGVLHASLDRGVVVSNDLASYVEGNRTQIGIVVARPVDPRSEKR